MNGLPADMSAYIGKGIDVAKYTLGQGISQMWMSYSSMFLNERVQFPDTASKLFSVCDYLESVRKLLPASSQRGVLSGHGLEEIRQCISDFSGATPTGRQMSFFTGYRVNPEYDVSDPDKFFLFSTKSAGAKYIDGWIDEIARSKDVKRIRLGPMDMLLDHGNEEIMLAQWAKLKFNRGYHHYVAARVVTNGSDPMKTAAYLTRILDIMPEHFVTTREHALF